MSLININRTLLQSKFRGTLLGTLVGDCCAVPFDGDSFTSGAKLMLQRYFDRLEGPYFKAPLKKHSKDSCMTKCVAQSLIEDPNNLDAKNLATSFAREFFGDPRRGYSENLVLIFNKLRANNFEEPFKPANESVNLTMSSDNAGAMRVSPVALMYLNNFENMLEIAKESTEITHTHEEGVMGSLLHCTAVHQNLLLDPQKDINIDDYTDNLLEKIAKLEKKNPIQSLRTNEETFTNQVKHIKSLLKKKTVPSDEEIINKLGHSTQALYSVPTAIYCFLRASQKIDEINTNSPFRRAIQYAISLGGDTITITSMTGTLAGAYHGDKNLNESLLKHCEGSEYFKMLADRLFEIVMDKNSNTK